jgi:SPP1 gp7 family putative phage head morphogenesis protein
MSYKENNIGFSLKPASKTADGTAQPLIMQQITVRPFNRQSQDITNWRNAQKAAEAMIPRRVTLYDLYHDLSTTDAQIISVWGKRVDAVTSAPWEFTDKDGNPVEAINELIDCIGFEELLKVIMDSKSWGYSMAEPTFFINDNGQHEFSTYSIPKKHMRPEAGIIADEQHSDKGTYIREGIYAKTIMEFGKSTDLGLFLSACMYAIYKRGDVADWAEFIEIFGRGIIDAEWDGFDESQRQKLATAIKEMGGGGVIIRPAGTKVDIKNSTGTANGDLQDKFAAKMDAYISKVLLGSTETTDSSKTSGYAQAEIHQEQDEKKNDTDLAFVRRYLNSRFIKVLKAAGFDTKGGTFVLKKVNKIDKAAFEVHKAMVKDLNVPVDDDFFYENYGVRKPDNYDQLKKEAEERRNAVLQQKTEQENADTPPASKDKKDKKPAKDKQELSVNPSVWRRLLRLFLPAPVLAKTPIAGANNCQCGEALTIKLASFVAEKVFDSLSDKLIKEAWEAKGKFEFSADLFNYTAATLLNGFLSGYNSPSLSERGQGVRLAALGFDYGIDDPASLTAFEMNLFRFAGVKTLYEAQQLNELFRQVKSFNEFYENASGMLKVHNRTWLETEYNTANAAGESAATYARQIKQKDLFPYWEYKTIGDNKVRDAHRLLEGVILPWDSPFWKYILPPNDWNCRCYIVPRTKGEVSEATLKESEAKVKAYLNSDAFKKAAKGGWGINRADKGLVFTENQHYANDYLDALDKMDKIKYEQYGLKDFKASQKAESDDFTPTYTDAQKDEAVNAFIASVGKQTARKYKMRDFANRPVVISKSTLRTHTNTNEEKYKTRHTLLTALKEVLAKPSEVWLNNYRGDALNNYIYVKHYKNMSIGAVTRLKDDLSLEIESWYKLEDDALRRALLVLNNKPK